MGVSSPIFSDNTFEFIQIDDYYSSSKKTYHDFPSKYSRYGKTLADFLPSTEANRHIHPDPDFKNFTYDQYVARDTPRSKIFENLEEGNILFFVCSMAFYNEAAYKDRDNKIKYYQSGKRHKYIFGFFTITGVAEVTISKDDIKITTLSGVIDPKIINQVPGYERDLKKLRCKNRLYLVVGDPKKSALLIRAIRLTKRWAKYTYILNNFGRTILQRKKDNIRGFRWVNDERLIKMIFKKIHLPNPELINKMKDYL